MIKKVTQIKKFGIFHNFSWQADLPKFNQFNLIYGWNRSGKTTLSRIFSSYENKSIFEDYQNSEFKIKMADGAELGSDEIEKSNLPIKVFNSEFIKENIFFDDQEKHCNPIVYISEEDIESKNKLDILKGDHVQHERNLKDAETLLKEKVKSEDSFRIGVASEISNALSWKTYDKRKVKEKIDEIGLEKFEKLSDEDLAKAKKMMIGEAKQMTNPYSEYELQFLFNGKMVSSLGETYEVIKGLLQKKVVAETVERLKQDQTLNTWVRQGFDLHSSKSEKVNCLFCQNSLDANFFDILSKHFSKDYEDLQSDITTLSNEVKKLCPSKVSPERNDLYSDLQTNYRDSAENLNKSIDSFENWINTVVAKLAEKKNAPFTMIELSAKPQDYVSDYNSFIKELNQVIEKHNTRTTNHDGEVKKAKLELELHYLADRTEKQKYSEMLKELNEATEAQESTKKARDRNYVEITTLEEKTSNTGRAISKINKYLEDFFGQKEVQLELDEQSNGYVLKRNGEIAKNLSEGEKTAIAFSYFITKVQEKDFEITKGIIFIDDPISSFDSNFIYHCFSIIKNHFKNAGQLFISTHNFEFFNLVKEWFCKKNGKKRKKGEDDICEFFMIENELKMGNRYAYVTSLDETLRKFKSEYHFLFHLLKEFAETETDEYKKFYIIGNIARRFLEIFTNFKIPSTGDLASKLGELETSSVSDVERDKVYKLINDFSHFIDPVGMVEHKDKSECKDAVKIMLRIVKEADPKHFEILKKQTTTN